MAKDDSTSTESRSYAKETARKRALENQDALAYYNLCNELGTDVEDTHLFEKGQAERGHRIQPAVLTEEKSELSRTEFESLPGQNRQVPYHLGVKVANVWGIRRTKDLQFALSINTLDNILRGINNIHIPYQMLDVMNPDEIISKFYGTGVMKRHNRHLRGDLPRDFFDLYREMDLRSYSRHNKQFLDMARVCNRRFPFYPGAQRQRLESIEQSVRDAFVESFFTEYVPSRADDPTHPSPYYDPNYPDGQDCKLCSREIYSKLKRLWDEAAILRGTDSLKKV